MNVIPAINCKEIPCLKKKLNKAAKFLPKNSWVQIDVSDGKFTKARTKITPKDLKGINPKGLKIETHLMIKNPEKVIDKWLEAGTKRVVVHAEAINNLRPITDNLKLKGKIGIAINPDTPAEKLFPYLNKIKFILLLAVKPGFSGQKIDKRILAKTKLLKAKKPSIKIEIDGGINLETALLVKKAGADIIVSGSYIWKSKNPEQAYKNLASLK